MNCRFCENKDTDMLRIVGYGETMGIMSACLVKCNKCKRSFFARKRLVENFDSFPVRYSKNYRKKFGAENIPRKLINHKTLF